MYNYYILSRVYISYTLDIVPGYIHVHIYMYIIIDLYNYDIIMTLHMFTNLFSTVHNNFNMML